MNSIFMGTGDVIRGERWDKESYLMGLIIECKDLRKNKITHFHFKEFFFTVVSMLLDKLLCMLP
ncbi:MAG: hypothetical protein KAH38_05085 [Candidatus Hydrogenedentes bacterium]|nr:hypothetical protein [Candidatus Hydrogenedentota bacterium]